MSSVRRFTDRLFNRGDALATGIGFILADYLPDKASEVALTSVEFSEPSAPPTGLPHSGILIRHAATTRGRLAEKFALGWFFPPELAQTLKSAAGEEWEERRDLLGRELSDQLVTDRYRLEETTVRETAAAWEDYLADGTPNEMGWTRYELSGGPGAPLDFWLGWPEPALRALFEVEEHENEVPRATERAAARPSARGEPPANMRRVLRTPVPLIVTLAVKDVPTSKLVDLGPGTLIEFDKPCDSPLELSANNLTVARGEAVKIGDHFGLRLTAVLSAEERAARLGGKGHF